MVRLIPGRPPKSTAGSDFPVRRRTASSLIGPVLALVVALGVVAAVSALRSPPDEQGSASLSRIQVAAPIPVGDYARPALSGVPGDFGRAQQSSSTQVRPVGESKPRLYSYVTARAAHFYFHFRDALLRECPGQNPAACQAALIGVTAGNLLGPDGMPVPIAVAGARLHKVLTDARAAGTQPLGAVVTLDAVLTSLRGQPVSLTWSLWQAGSRSRLHGDWLNSNLVYLVTPTADHTTATFAMWIPLPTTPGPYLVHADLSTRQSPLAQADSLPFD